jgi:ATP-binding cassette subfamily B protein
MVPVVAPRRGLRRLQALWRVRSYVRPYRAQMLTMLTAALLGIGAGIVIPLVTKAIVDGPVARGERSLLLPLALLGFGLGAVESFFTFLRRWVQSSAVLGLETAMRSDLYRHLQRLGVSFHDRWQSGQLLSRAVTDLGVIRRFVGFGLIFLVVNLLTYITVLVLLLRLSDIPWAGDVKPRWAGPA